MRHRGRIFLLVSLVCTLSACTVVRYADEDAGGDNNGGNNANTKSVDMLIMMDLDRSAANLTSAHADVVGKLIAGLEAQGIAVRKAALAPLYRRAEGVVPILYGLNDETNQFNNLGEAVAFYTYDSGADYLIDAATTDGANLATLGSQLDQRSIYKPEAADPLSRPYFEGAADGFVVVTLSATPRRCGAGAVGCEIDGVAPEDYFTRVNEVGQAQWLELAGGEGLPVDKIYHAAFVTREGIGYDQFYEECTDYPNFPTTLLDVMAPSENVYFERVNERIANRGGHGLAIDLCEAYSGRADFAVGGVVAEIRNML